MRRKLLMGLCLAVLVSFAAGDYLFNRSRGGQDAPKKAEPGEKKDELFDILKKSLEAKSEPGAVPPLPDSPVPMVPPPVSFKKDVDKKPAEPTLPPLEKPVEALPPTKTPLVSPPLPPVSEQKPVVPQLPPDTSAPPLTLTPPAVQPKPAAVPMPEQLATPPPDQARYDQTGYPKQAFDPPANPAQTPINPPTASEVKPAIGTDNPSLGNTSMPPPPVTIVSPVKAKSSPWRLNVEVVEGQTIVTATVNKKYEFKVVCQSLDLQTGSNSFKASGKVQISGDAMTGHCERLTISLTDDRLVLEGAAELSIQKTVTTVSSDDGKPAAFELKGETLNLRISELEAGKFLQTSWLKPDLDVGTDKTITRTTTADGKRWSPYGTLRRSKSENGSAWRLENAAGQPILHLLTSGDRVLEQYEGRTISVIGTAVDKMTVRVTHIAVP